MHLLKTTQGLLELLVYFPVLLFIGAFVLPDSSLWKWLSSFVFVFCTGLLFRTVVSNKKVGLYLLFSIAVAAVQALSLSINLYFTIVTFLIGSIITYRGTLYAFRDRIDLFPSSYLWVVGLPIYVASHIIFRYVDSLTSYLSLINWFGLCLLVFTLFVSNSEHLNAATLSKQAKPTLSNSLKRQNQFYIVATILFVVFITNLHVIQSVVYQTVVQTIRGIIWLLTLGGGEESTPEQQGSNGQPSLPAAEQSDPSALAVWLERIMYVFVILLLIGAILWLFVFLFKRSRQLLAKGYRWLRLVLNQVLGEKDQVTTHQSYTDDKESLMDWKQFREKQKDRAKEWVSQLFPKSPKWNRMTTEQKVRYIYKKLVKIQGKHGITVSSHLTVRETLEVFEKAIPERKTELEQLKNAYEQVRYSHQEGQGVQVESFISLIENKGKG